jgi:hypothetical protein
LDLFYVDLGAGPSLKATTVMLTRAGFSSDSRATGQIDTVSMTRDGRHIGITSFRDLFTFPAVSAITPLRPSPDAREAYVIDIAGRTLDRVVLGSDGSDADGSVLGAVSLSSDASLVCFISQADNLIFGDANQVADAFVANRVATASKPPPGNNNRPKGILSIGTSVGASPHPLRVHAVQRPDGSLLLKVTVPGSGQLTAIARQARAARPHRSRSGGSKRSPVIANAAGNARRSGTTTLVIHLLHRYAGLLRDSTGVRAEITVTWSPHKPKLPKKAALAAVFKRVGSHRAKHKK